MIRTLYEFSPDDQEPEAANPRLRRLFHRIRRASVLHWISIGDDGRSNSDRGIITSATGGYPAWLTLNAVGSAYRIRIRVNAGPLVANTPDVRCASLALQQPDSCVRVTPDVEDGVLWIDASGFFPSEPCDPEPIVALLIQELQQVLDDDRLRALVKDRSNRAHV